MNTKTKNKYSDLLDYLEASIWVKLQNNFIQDNNVTNNTWTLIDNNENDLKKSITRDETRKKDLINIRKAIEYSYQDSSEYPNKENFHKIINTFMKIIPKDPLWSIIKDWCQFWYFYEVWDDSNWIKNQTYKLSACFENESSLTKNDIWNFSNKYEIWIWWWVYKEWLYIK
jgi:hypothetical protein